MSAAKRHDAEKVYVATVALTESAAVATLTKRAAAFYGEPPERIGLVITSVEQYETEEMYSIRETVRSETRFSVEGYAYIKEARR